VNLFQAIEQGAAPPIVWIIPECLDSTSQGQEAIRAVARAVASPENVITNDLL
jgi:hypothetical protein